MASIMNRIRAFARSPQGQRLASRAQRELSKPSNQQKLRQLSNRLKGRRY